MGRETRGSELRPAADCRTGNCERREDLEKAGATLAYDKDGVKASALYCRAGSPQTITCLFGGTTGTWGSDGTILFSNTCLAAQHQRARSCRAGGNDAGTGIDRPPTTVAPAPGTAVTALRGRTGRRAGRVSYGASAWLFAGASTLRAATLRSQKANHLRRADRRRGLGCLRTHRGTGAPSTSDAGVLIDGAGRPTTTRLSRFDRSADTSHRSQQTKVLLNGPALRPPPRSPDSEALRAARD